MDFARAHYDDGTVACDEVGLAIQRYYPWGSRRIRYGEIRDLTVLHLSDWSAIAPWRIWGPADLEHWWNLDTHRTEKHVALVLETGDRFKPTVTPTDPEGFERVLRAHLNGLAQLREDVALARLTTSSTPAIPRQRDVPERMPDRVPAIVPDPTTRVPS
jgi:hypothetical protein